MTGQRDDPVNALTSGGGWIVFLVGLVGLGVGVRCSLVPIFLIFCCGLHCIDVLFFCKPVNLFADMVPSVVPWLRSLRFQLCECDRLLGVRLYRVPTQRDMRPGFVRDFRCG